jgi:hypothetical protein
MDGLRGGRTKAFSRLKHSPPASFRPLPFSFLSVNPAFSTCGLLARPLIFGAFQRRRFGWERHQDTKIFQVNGFTGYSIFN